MLAKSHRLSKTSDVQTVFARGRAFFNPLFTIKFLSRPKPQRFTVVVSTKVAKSAVKRNRLKRLLREFIRLRLANFKSGDYAVVLKPASARQEGAALIKQFSDLCRKSKLLSL